MLDLIPAVNPDGTYGRNSGDSYCEATVLPDLGEVMPPVSGGPCFYWMHKGGKLGLMFLKVGAVIYSVDTDHRVQPPQVVGLDTHDAAFRTPEGVAVGWQMSAVLAIPEAGVPDQDDDCSILLPSGWIAEFRGAYSRAGDRADCLQVAAQDRPVVTNLKRRMPLPWPGDSPEDLP